MEGTRRVVLDDVLDVASGQIDPREEPYCNLMHVGGDNISSHTGELHGLRCAGDLNLISGKYEFGPQDVLYSKIRPALNKVALPDFVGVCSADIYPLRPRKGLLERRYLAYLLRNQDFLAFAAKHSSRTNIPKINREALLAYQVSLPPVSEQCRIADILDKAGAIRRKRKEAITVTDELVRSTFLEMFGDPIRNPKGWKVVQLGDLAEDLRYGTSEKCGSSETHGSLPVLRIPNVANGTVDWTDLKYARLSRAESERLAMQRGDILFVRSNGNPDLIGRCAVYDSSRTALFASYLIRARIREGVSLASYLRGVFSSPSYRKVLTGEARTTAGNYNIGAETLRRLRVPIPSRSLVERYCAIDGAIRRQLRTLDKARKTSEELFGSLVERAFSRSGA